MMNANSLEGSAKKLPRLLSIAPTFIFLIVSFFLAQLGSGFAQSDKDSCIFQERFIKKPVNRSIART
jgi:hypothetical protein